MTVTMTADIRRWVTQIIVSMFVAGSLSAAEFIYALRYYLTPPVGTELAVLTP